MIEFANPWWAVLLLLTPIIIGLCWYLQDFRQKVLSSIASEEMQQIITVPRSKKVFIVKSIALAFSWICLVLSLMDPIGNQRSITDTGPGPKGKGARQVPQDVIFLIDASSSMKVNDIQGASSRFDDAKDLAELIIQELRGQNVGIYAYTSEPTLLSPPTPDYLYAMLTLRSMKINEGNAQGTNISEALDGIIAAYKEDSLQKKHTLVLMSDGGDNSIESAADSTTQNQNLMDKVKKLSSQGWNVVIVGLGSLKGGEVPDIIYQGKKVSSKLDEQILKNMALAGNGKYLSVFQLGKLDVVKQIKEYIMQASSRMPEVAGNVSQKVVYDHYFQIPLMFAALLLGFVLLYPDTKTFC